MSKLITPGEAEALQDLYIETRAEVVNEALGYTDARNFYFSYEEMKTFMKHVKDKSEDHGYENIGIRFFLGAHPANEEEPSLSTLFMSATRDHGTINSKEIKPMDFAEPSSENY